MLITKKIASSVDRKKMHQLCSWMKFILSFDEMCDIHHGCAKGMNKGSYKYLFNVQSSFLHERLRSVGVVPLV